MQTAVQGDFQLGAHAIGGGDQNRVLIARRLGVKQAAKTAQRPVRAGTGRGPRQRPDGLDECIARINIHTCRLVTQPGMVDGFSAISDYGCLPVQRWLENRREA